MVGVVPNAAYRHFADRDELLAAVCAAAMDALAGRMAAGVSRVRGKHGDAAAARRRLRALGTAYLAFAREDQGWSPPRLRCHSRTLTGHTPEAIRIAGRSTSCALFSTSLSTPASYRANAAGVSNFRCGPPSMALPFWRGVGLCATFLEPRSAALKSSR